MDEGGIRRFVDEDYPRVVAAVALITGDRAAAEDAVQDALIKAWPRAGLHNLAGWITVVASNGARSRLRRRRSEERAYERAAALPPSGSAPPVGDVLPAVRSLPPLQRQVVVLHYYLDLSVSEVASALGCAEGTVKTSLHRARRALAAALDERTGEDDRARS
jgi:RNA polymerase sigma-70 factor, ECF subfamily